MVKITRLSNGGVVKLNIERLDMIEKALGSRFVTQLGVLGSKAANRMAIGNVSKKGGHTKSKTKESSQTNAEIGLVHEFGSYSRGIKRRSFLLAPLQIKAVELMKVRTILWHKFLAGDQSVDSLKKSYGDLGIKAENIVQGAFETGGYGKWPAISNATRDRKNSSAILIDTAQLRRSIDSRVVTR